MKDEEAYIKLIEKRSRNEEYEYVTTQTILHYVSYTEEKLIKALNWKKKGYYYTVYKIANILAGILNTNHADYKGLRKLIDNYKYYGK